MATLVSTSLGDSRPPADGIGVLGSQSGARVLEVYGEAIVKTGNRVRPLLFSSFTADRDCIGMPIIPGSTLLEAWDGLDDAAKERICHETWALIARLRKIPRPTELSHLFQCSADGSPTNDPLIKALDSPPSPILNDAGLRARIEERCAHLNGRRYTAELPDMLLRSKVSVFTHADIAPRNIMVDDSGHITAIIDWQAAGWYPNYWEYANIMKPQPYRDEWQDWMDRTAPQKWDLSGFRAARRVLF